MHDHQTKTEENDNFLTKQSPFLSPDFIQGSMVIVIPKTTRVWYKIIEKRLYLVFIFVFIFASNRR